MKILSLFDGISCARVALEKSRINVESYFASEIDKYAIQISQKNYPDIVHVGNIESFTHYNNISNKLYRIWSEQDEGYQGPFDLLIGGSPCQDLSIAKAGRKGLDGERSGLFYEYVRILKEVQPKYFILENVASMSKESRDKISEVLGVEPIMINAALVSAQSRKRLFWVGKLVDNKYEQVNIELPEDRKILLKDILEDADTDRLKSYCIDANYWKGSSLEHYLEKGVRQLVFSTKNLEVKGITKSGTFGNRKISRSDKAYCLAANPSSDQLPKVEINQVVRKLTPIECERLQSLPDNYTEGVSNTQRYKCLGNAFNVDVVAHILKHLTT